MGDLRRAERWRFPPDECCPSKSQAWLRHRLHTARIPAFVLNLYGTCMEFVWSLYGVCMEYVWNNTLTTPKQHPSNTPTTPYQPGGRPFLLSFSMAQGFGQGSDRSECRSDYANTHCNSNGGGRTPGGGGGFGRGVAGVAAGGRD